MKINVDLKEKSYDIIIEQGGLSKLNEYINLNRKVLIITDDLVPIQYAETVKNQCKEGYIEVVCHGEGAKSFPVFEHLCSKLLELKFNRGDLVVAVGGGVIGDLSGFVASSYMRGIDFVNVPTTTLSQIDSSIGGKTAINLDGVKNVIGQFYQPKLVLIDKDTLKTLPKRHFVNGLVEAIKAGLIYDSELFCLFEQDELDVDKIIYRSLLVKKDVVEKDEKEKNLRKILNFGHTLGHGFESLYNLSELYHGEAVAIGMLFMIEDEALKERVKAVYKKLSLKNIVPYDKDKLFELMLNDKKADDDGITIVKVKELGKAYLERIKTKEILSYI